MTVEVLTASTRQALRAEKIRLKNRLSELDQERKQVEGAIVHVSSILKVSMNGHGHVHPGAETATKPRTLTRKGKGMKRGEGPKWAVLIAGKMKTKMPTMGMVRIARANMPMVWRQTTLTDSEIAARLGANLATAERLGLAKADRNWSPIEWQLTAAGWKMYEQEAAWRRDLRNQKK